MSRSGGSRRPWSEAQPSDLPPRRGGEGDISSGRMKKIALLAAALVACGGGSGDDDGDDDDVPAVEAALETYAHTYEAEQRATLAAKLGLPPLRDEKGAAAEDPNSDEAFVDELFEVLAAVETDFTLFFRALAKLRLDDEAGWLSALSPTYYSAEPLPEAARLRTLAAALRAAQASSGRTSPSSSERIQASSLL